LPFLYWVTLWGVCFRHSLPLQSGVSAARGSVQQATDAELGGGFGHSTYRFVGSCRQSVSITSLQIPAACLPPLHTSRLPLSSTPRRRPRSHRHDRCISPIRRTDPSSIRSRPKFLLVLAQRRRSNDSLGAANQHGFACTACSTHMLTIFAGYFA